MKNKICVLPGDGIGPEIITEAVKCLKAVEKAFNREFEYFYGKIGGAAIDECGDPFPIETETMCKEADAILFGAIGDPKYDNNPKAKTRPEQGLLKMRKVLGLYANVRPVKIYESLIDKSPIKAERIKGCDFVIYRELIGGIYFGEPRGRSENGETAFDACVYSKNEIDRITRLAFEAAKNRKGKLTLVDKANVLATSRLWRETVSQIHQNEFPEITLDYLFVDNAAMKIITSPVDFDVILTENMFGDILSDEASVITGSIGLMSSASIGANVSLFEPIHGSYPQMAGKNRANPIAAILSAAMMLELSFGYKKESEAILNAVKSIVDDGYLTEELVENGKSVSTSQIGDRISSLILKNPYLY